MIKNQLTIESVTPVLKLLPYQYATDAVAGFGRGCRILGKTKGQFSLVDLIMATLQKTGPADVIISTWAAGLRDARVMDKLVKTDQIRSFNLLVDRSLSSRHPDVANSILALFGEDAIRTSNTHEKYVMISNEDYKVTIKTSMNLNQNPRYENFDLDENSVIYDWFMEQVQELFELMPAGMIQATRLVNPAFDASMSDNVTNSGVNEFPTKTKNFGW